jgi:hypothetical protein
LCEHLASGLSSERANEHPQRFITMIAQRARLPPASRSSTGPLSGSDHNAATPSMTTDAVRVSATVGLQAIT